MKLLIQRVTKASCEVDGRIISHIGKGILVFLGIEKDDDMELCKKLGNKCLNLRIFDDHRGKLNLSVIDIKGEVLVISQFTLCADCKKGLRPAFDNAEKGEKALELYKAFIKNIKEMGINVKEGVFGASMAISLLNDGPVTFMLSD
ncbi:MAG: D-aminoacyl-tRNA deacylase [bacterium]|nr:D-aminoacyl-tRNA deacylase [bacterium]